MRKCAQGEARSSTPRSRLPSFSLHFPESGGNVVWGLGVAESVARLVTSFRVWSRRSFRPGAVHLTLAHHHGAWQRKVLLISLSS